MELVFRNYPGRMYTIRDARFNLLYEISLPDYITGYQALGDFDGDGFPIIYPYA